MIIGYTTGTFDLLHPGHLEFLKTSKAMCDRLIVGLTSDRLAVIQKRKPFFSYQHRYDLLSVLKYVDSVIEHDGQTKDEAYKMFFFSYTFYWK